MRAPPGPEPADDGTARREAPQPASTAPDAPPQPRPAASIVLVRDCAGGLEVLMMERHRAAAVAFAGALVFPGGKVDAADAGNAWPGLDVDAAGPDAGPDRAFRIAAVRETFEEAGILLARSRDANANGGGALVGGSEARRLVDVARSGTASRFADLLGRERLVPALDALVHFGHWITPLWAPRRFDTHFFLAAAPAGQHLVPDPAEAAALLWMRPADVLAEADAGCRMLVDVTRFTLELLGSWADVATALAAARARRVVTILPTREMLPDGSHLLRIPAAAGYLRSELHVVRR